MAAINLTAEGIEKFLAGQWVDGIGKVYAQRIVQLYGIDSIKILLTDPQRVIKEIEGIGEAKISKITDSLKSLKYNPELIAFLFQCGIGDIFVERILGKYQKKAEEIVLSDPYSMVENVWQLSFFIADKIGRQLNIPSDNPKRLEAALVTAVKKYAEDGHLFATPEEATQLAAGIAGVDKEKIFPMIAQAVSDGRLVESRGGLYLPVFYKAEKDCAKKLMELAATPIPSQTHKVLPTHTQYGDLYTPRQLLAIRQAIESPVVVLTGGPGTGKTTVLKGIINLLEEDGKRVILTAPTGRAAKRMATMTGHEAMTIHRLLGYRQGTGYNHKLIDTDVLIIDEGSMMEQVLFNHLLQSLRPGTRIIMVGDVDQLPAIGAGDVLRDMISSGSIPVVALDENFRQYSGSGIAAGARSINKGELPVEDSRGEFLIIPEEGQKNIYKRVMDLVSRELPQDYNISPEDIIVVTPQQIGTLGARNLNVEIQKLVNPEGPSLQRGAAIFREGDPVMQTTNTPSRGVYNGETGKIVEVNPQQETLVVKFQDGRESLYTRKELGELTLAYSTTVHKLQGSEVRNMIFIITMAHRPMLYRNLLYTGVSRASHLCVIVGEPEALTYGITHTPATTRNSNFKHRLQSF